MEILSNRKEYNKDTGTMIEKSASVSFDFSKVLERKNGATSERQDLIQQFVNKINATAKKKCGWAQINGQLRNCDIHDLYILFKECDSGKCFGALFWYKVKKNSWKVEKPLDD